MTNRRILWGGLLVVVLLFGAAVFVSPYWVLRDMRAAVQSRDAARLSEHVDFPSLRDDLKSQLTLKMMHAAGQTGEGHAASGLASALVLGLVDRAVDAMVSPAGIQMMFEREQVRIKPGSGEPPTGSSAPSDEEQRPRRDFKLSYDSWNQVRIHDADGSPGAFILRRHGLFNWKLAAMILPVDQP